MKIRILTALLCVMPYCVAFAAVDNTRSRAINSSRVSMAAAVNIGAKNINAVSGDSSNQSGGGVAVANSNKPTDDTDETSSVPVIAENENCREAYRACMDEFCLMDEPKNND